MSNEPSGFEVAQLPRATVERASGSLRGLLAATRIALGWVFLWAFVDKTFGLGFGTEPAKAWIDGGSPTFGFLNFATRGPFAEIFQAIAGHPVVDVLFMAGLLAIGVALTLGVGMRLAALGASLMMALMYLAALPPENNPLIDDHIVYALVVWILPLVRAGEVFGLGRWWKDKKLVRDHPWLG